MTALNLLRATSVAEALPLAEGLDLQNRERQDIERKIVEGLMVDLRARFDPTRDFVLVEGHEDWHPGVLGIVASRVMRTFYRPTLILGGGRVEWKGSGRSIEGFDLAAGLERCGELLLKHGGHAMAAGVSMEPSRLGELRERLNAIVSREVAQEELIPSLRLDAESRFCDVNFAILEQLERLGPFGMGNPPIQLFTRRLKVIGSAMRMGREEQHLKFRAQDETGVHEVVWWNGAGSEFPVGSFDMAYAPSVSEYRGRRSIQLKLLDWRAC